MTMATRREVYNPRLSFVKVLPRKVCYYRTPVRERYVWDYFGMPLVSFRSPNHVAEWGETIKIFGLVKG